MLTRAISFLSIIMWLTACTTATLAPTATAEPTSTWTPAPTLTPSPTPTPLPAMLKLRSPAEVSAVNPVYVEVLLVPPASGTVTAGMIASVLTPDGKVYARFNLRQQGELRYVAEQPLMLPLDPPDGVWRLVVGLSASRPIIGAQTLDFLPAPVAFQELADVLPAGVTLRLPQVFDEVLAQGNERAGGRVWRYGKGELALWWAPGPTEELLYDNALVMLEASHAASGEETPELLAGEETDWQGRAAFRFQEQWPGREGGPAETWVLQDDAHWLYVLRARACGVEEIPALLAEVQATFMLAGEW